MLGGTVSGRQVRVVWIFRKGNGVGVIHAVHVVIHLPMVHLAVIHAAHRYAVMVHACMAVAVLHGTHAHLGMAQQRRRVHLRHRRGHGRVGCQGATGKAAAVDTLGKQGVGLIRFGFHDHIQSFSHAQAHLVEGHRFDRLAIHGDHGHVQAGNADIEEGHGAGVDKAQAEAFPRIELAGPVAVGALAIHQVGVGVTGHVGQVPVAHAHGVPHMAILEGLDHALVAEIAQGVEHGAFVEIVVVAELFQGGEDVVRVLVTPV